MRQYFNTTNLSSLQLIVSHNLVGPVLTGKKDAIGHSTLVL